DHVAFIEDHDLRRLGHDIVDVLRSFHDRMHIHLVTADLACEIGVIRRGSDDLQLRLCSASNRERCNCSNQFMFHSSLFPFLLYLIAQYGCGGCAPKIHVHWKNTMFSSSTSPPLCSNSMRKRRNSLQYQLTYGATPHTSSSGSLGFSVQSRRVPKYQSL